MRKYNFVNRILAAIFCSFFLVGQLAAEEQTTQAETDNKTEANAVADEAYGAYQQGQYLTAFKLALDRAEKGDAAAQTLIAIMYEKGEGVKQDLAEATVWYGIAANSGNRDAQFAYALRLLQGQGVEQNLEDGFAMMEKAAVAGHPQAMFNHANQIIDQRPTSAGYRRALPFFEKAAEASVVEAFYALAQIYKAGKTNGIQDPDKARMWLKRAADSGFDTAQIELAIEYLQGTNGPKDPVKAFAYFNQAAVRGNAIAQNRLAKMYAFGVGTDISPVEAAKWHILATRAGLADIDLEQFVKTLDEDTRQLGLVQANQWRAKQ